jgi:hypothetical protein
MPMFRRPVTPTSTPRSRARKAGQQGRLQRLRDAQQVCSSRKVDQSGRCPARSVDRTGRDCAAISHCAAIRAAYRDSERPIRASRHVPNGDWRLEKQGSAPRSCKQNGHAMKEDRKEDETRQRPQTESIGMVLWTAFRLLMAGQQSSNADIPSSSSSSSRSSTAESDDSVDLTWSRSRENTRRDCVIDFANFEASRRAQLAEPVQDDEMRGQAVMGARDGSGRQMSFAWCRGTVVFRGRQFPHH